MENFTPVSATLGGALIGLSASILLLSNGKIAGISSIVGKLVARPSKESLEKFVFFAGLLFGGILLTVLYPTAFDVKIERSIPILTFAGLLVGIGTRIGSGCTSGHGVCGLSRLSVRSLAATICFMGAGFAVATLLEGVL
ncbi:MAG: YeeE/YedE thiosulfate transporter family protein [Myxococcota bacterium]|nr:YeeE/YedE thiosulfate transporter family protein [Myxococcota bacterium]